MYTVHTKYVLCTYLFIPVPVHTFFHFPEPLFTGFLGVQHDANMQVPDAQQPVHGVELEYGYLPVLHFRVRASRTATEGSGSPGYATATPV